jgi:hypothetical protein
VVFTITIIIIVFTFMHFWGLVLVIRYFLSFMIANWIIIKVIIIIIRIRFVIFKKLMFIKMRPFIMPIETRSFIIFIVIGFIVFIVTAKNFYFDPIFFMISKELKYLKLFYLKLLYRGHGFTCLLSLSIYLHKYLLSFHLVFRNVW